MIIAHSRRIFDTISPDGQTWTYFLILECSHEIQELCVNSLIGLKSEFHFAWWVISSESALCCLTIRTIFSFLNSLLINSSSSLSFFTRIPCFLIFPRVDAHYSLDLHLMNVWLWASLCQEIGKHRQWLGCKDPCILYQGL